MLEYHQYQSSVEWIKELDDRDTCIIVETRIHDMRHGLVETPE